MAFEQKYTDIETKDVVVYIKKRKVVSWQGLEQKFNAPRGVVRYRLKDQRLFPCLFNKGQYFTLYDLVKDEISDDGLWEHDTFVFFEVG